MANLMNTERELCTAKGDRFAEIAASCVAPDVAQKVKEAKVQLEKKRQEFYLAEDKFCNLMLRQNANTYQKKYKTFLTRGGDNMKMVVKHLLKLSTGSTIGDDKMHQMICSF